MEESIDSNHLLAQTQFGCAACQAGVVIGGRVATSVSLVVSHATVELSIPFEITKETHKPRPANNATHPIRTLGAIGAIGDFGSLFGRAYG